MHLAVSHLIIQNVTQLSLCVRVLHFHLISTTEQKKRKKKKENFNSERGDGQAMKQQRKKKSYIRRKTFLNGSR